MHNWGHRNRVSFDLLKEEFVVIAADGGNDKAFKYLSPTVDSKLLMNDCVDKVYSKAKSKARMLLRSRRFYGMSDLPILYKGHARSQIEWCNAAMFHAAPSRLERLDSVQPSFLAHFGLPERDALIRFNVAPLRVRRDIGVLGVLWKISHGQAHPCFNELFEQAPAVNLSRRVT